MGELHLQIYAERMKREYDVKVSLSKPTVNFRETISCWAGFDYLHRKQSGGAGQFARVIGYIEPIVGNDIKNMPCKFENNTVGMNIPNEYITAIQKAFFETIARGPQTGFPIIGVKYVLTDGETHVVDSSSYAFSMAAKGAFWEAFQSAEPIILEPIMNIEVLAPLQYQNTIIAQIAKRKGEIFDTDTSGSMIILHADVPLNQMFGYSAELRTLTQGQGEYSMEYKNHNQVKFEDAMKIRDLFSKKIVKKRRSEGGFNA